MLIFDYLITSTSHACICTSIFFMSSLSSSNLRPSPWRLCLDLAQTWGAGERNGSETDKERGAGREMLSGEKEVTTSNSEPVIVGWLKLNKRLRCFRSILRAISKFN